MRSIEAAGGVGEGFARLALRLGLTATQMHSLHLSEFCHRYLNSERHRLGTEGIRSLNALGRKCPEGSTAIVHTELRGDP